MGADAIRHDRQAVSLVRGGCGCPLSHRFDADGVDAQRQVVSMLFGVSDGEENDLPFFCVRGKQRVLRVALRYLDGVRTEDEVCSLRGEGVDAGETVVAQGIQ